MKSWRIASDDSPGYLGARRNEDRANRDEKYGKGNWRLGWLANGEILDFVGACRLYEDAYVAYLIQRPELLDHLCSLASDVYDDAESNVDSGFDYTIQETNRTHIQDIALRNALVRLHRKFEGDKLVQIRDSAGKTAISKALSPGQVPFHLSRLITTPSNLEEVYAHRWWLPGSVEDFYQRNKRVLVCG